MTHAPTPPAASVDDRPLSSGEAGILRRFHRRFAATGPLDGQTEPRTFGIFAIFSLF